MSERLPDVRLKTHVTMHVRLKDRSGKTVETDIRVLHAPFYGTSKWHNSPQWLVWIRDASKEQSEIMALKDIVPFTHKVVI